MMHYFKYHVNSGNIQQNTSIYIKRKTMDILVFVMIILGMGMILKLTTSQLGKVNQAERIQIQL
ncbi:hypothetical protein DP804_23325 [Salmonella enterica subsp. enterica]|nr:hypothetical protein [Salmonella enterica subsp. enterica serovar Virchow]